MIDHEERMKRLIASVDAAVLEHNANHADQMQLVWGSRSKEDEDSLRKQFVGEDLQQDGLLSHGGWDFELTLNFGIGPDYVGLLTIQIEFGELETLPRTAPELYNVLSACRRGVRLEIWPDSDGDEEDDEILIMGVGTTMPVATLTADGLMDAMLRLGHSVDHIHGALDGEEDDDEWVKDCEPDGDG